VDLPTIDADGTESINVDADADEDDDVVALPTVD